MAVPHPVYVLVVDQRGLEADIAAKVADIMCQRHAIQEIYWIFKVNDPSSYGAAHSFPIPEGCTVTLTNSLGLGVDKAYQSLFGKYAKLEKYLLLLPSAQPTLQDEAIINKLPFTGVTIIEVALNGDETVIAR